jgi:hypothetical protein
MKDGVKKVMGIPTNYVIMEMNVLGHDQIMSIINSGGCSLIEIVYSNSTEINENVVEFFCYDEAAKRMQEGRAGFISAFYCVKKSPRIH